MTKNSWISVTGGLLVLVGMICLYVSGTTMFVFGISFNVVGWCIILVNYLLKPGKREN